MGMHSMGNCRVYGKGVCMCGGQNRVKVSPAPNPAKFTIISIAQFGDHVLASIRYPDCTNFEGVKICVYEKTTVSSVREAHRLDPHFSKTGLSPIARFEPSQRGLDLAAAFMASVLMRPEY